MIPQLRVDADDLANVAEDRNDDVIGNEAGLSRRYLEQLQFVSNIHSICIIYIKKNCFNITEITMYWYTFNVKTMQFTGPIFHKLPI